MGSGCRHYSRSVQNGNRGVILMDISKAEFKKICEMQIKMKVAYCYICGKPIHKIQDYNIDHVFPRSRLGPDSVENWAMVHKNPCNSHKGALSSEEYYLFNVLNRVRTGHKDERDLEILQRIRGAIHGVQLWECIQRKK